MKNTSSLTKLPLLYTISIPKDIPKMKTISLISVVLTLMLVVLLPGYAAGLSAENRTPNQLRIERAVSRLKRRMELLKDSSDAEKPDLETLGRVEMQLSGMRADCAAGNLQACDKTPAMVKMVSEVRERELELSKNETARLKTLKRIRMAIEVLQRSSRPSNKPRPT